MRTNRAAAHRLREPEIPATGFGADALAGLRAMQKTLPAKYLYDAEGSALFERITELPEYYPTRTEISILREAGPELARIIGPQAVLIEFGGGSGLKAELLLRHMERPAGYGVVEISRAALEATRARLASAFPGLPLRCIEADFSALRPRAEELPAGRRAGFFPGSTIGNLEKAEAIAFLAGRRAVLGEGALFVLGADLIKPLGVLLPAYDDAQGVTAAFNLNLIHRLNRELGAGLDPGQFRHEARWNPAHARVEMHLVVRAAQSARIAGEVIRFRAGESIHTENSHKFTPAQIEAMAGAAGWRTLRVLTDPKGYFGVFVLQS
ncbi:MAG: L-histidine N(alpha)-methyltransferase [Hyphomonadaceae bacterium]|nr:L-histidine N(alpha)-methyltransferase [Hyphomonadaceae bacterium]